MPCIPLATCSVFILVITLCGGECAEDITEHLRNELSQVECNVCSAGTLLRMQKELATEKETTISATGLKHNFNMEINSCKLRAIGLCRKL